MDQLLIVFTRYPEAGQAKTRLIPALGAEGAAQLHRQLVEHTLVQVRQLQTILPIATEIWFAGGELADMQAWLGSEWQYQLQGEGDLGDRMSEAFRVSFARSAQHVMIIGTDCPGLDAELLAVAFHALSTHDLVIGPAVDGGYYLIGLSQYQPALFRAIHWSTAVVLQQTLAIANQLDLTIAELPTLTDIDRPEDLQSFQINPNLPTLLE